MTGHQPPRRPTPRPPQGLRASPLPAGGSPAGTVLGNFQGLSGAHPCPCRRLQARRPSARWSQASRVLDSQSVSGEPAWPPRSAPRKAADEPVARPWAVREPPCKARPIMLQCRPAEEFSFGPRALKDALLSTDPALRQLYTAAFSPAERLFLAEAYNPQRTLFGTLLIRTAFDWLLSRPEAPEDFQTFHAALPPRKQSLARKHIYLQPIGTCAHGYLHPWVPAAHGNLQPLGTCVRFLTGLLAPTWVGVPGGGSEEGTRGWAGLTVLLCPQV